MYQWAHGYCGKVVAVEANDATVYQTGYVQKIRKGDLEMQYLSLHNCDWICKNPTQSCIFFEFLFINIYNLLSKVYDLAKFQPHMPITLGITAIQTEKSICTASIGKINYRWLLQQL